MVYQYINSSEFLGVKILLETDYTPCYNESRKFEFVELFRSIELRVDYLEGGKHGRIK